MTPPPTLDEMAAELATVRRLLGVLALLLLGLAFTGTATLVSLAALVGAVCPEALR